VHCNFDLADQNKEGTDPEYSMLCIYCT